MAKKTEDDDSLKRLGGGRWQTRDERFTIEPQSGTWVVIDAEQTDDLGLPLVRGPFGSLTAVKAAIGAARGAEPAVSPLASKVAEHVDRPAPLPTRGGRPYVARGSAPGARPEPAPPTPAPASALRATAARKPARPPEPEPVAEPKWLRDLEPREHDRALELLARLAKAGAPDPDGIAEREMAGKAPAVAAFAVQRVLAEVGPGAAPAAIALLLLEGSAADLDVSWKLVDGEGRPIRLGSDVSVP